MKTLKKNTRKLPKAIKVEAEKVKKVIAVEDISKDIAVEKAFDLVKEKAVIAEGEPPKADAGRAEKKSRKRRNKFCSFPPMLYEVCCVEGGKAKMSNLVPYVIEQTNRGERSYDIFSRLLNDRIVMLTDEVNDTSASLVVAQLLYLEGQDPDEGYQPLHQQPGRFRHGRHRNL